MCVLSTLIVLEVSKSIIILPRREDRGRGPVLEALCLCWSPFHAPAHRETQGRPRPRPLSLYLLLPLMSSITHAIRPSSCFPLPLSLSRSLSLLLFLSLSLSLSLSHALY